MQPNARGVTNHWTELDWTELDWIELDWNPKICFYALWYAIKKQSLPGMTN